MRVSSKCCVRIGIIEENICEIQNRRVLFSFLSHKYNHQVYECSLHRKGP